MEEFTLFAEAGMRGLVAVVVVAMAGCAMTPDQLRISGERFVKTLKQPPSLAAACMTRNLENGNNAIYALPTPAMRAGVAQGSVEISAPGMLLADITPSGAGSQATIWRSQHLGIDRYITSFEGC